MPGDSRRLPPWEVPRFHPVACARVNENILLCEGERPRTALPWTVRPDQPALPEVCRSPLGWPDPVHPARGREPEDARTAPAGPAHRHLLGAGGDPGRDRHRQGARRPRPARQQPARRRAVRRGQLRRHPRDAPRERALRPRPRRLHRRRHRPAGLLRGGARRHALPRRDRRDPAAAPGQAPPRPPGRRGPRRSGRTARSQVDVRILAATHRDLEALVARGRVPRGPLLPAQRRLPRRAAAARAARGHPAPRAAFLVAPPASRHRVQPGSVQAGPPRALPGRGTCGSS